MDSGQGLAPKRAEYCAHCHRRDDEKDWQPLTGMLLASLYQLGTVRKRSALTAIVGRGGGTTLAFDAAIRSFLSEAKTLKWSQK